ncbi:MAG TPA: ribbon-helix-helix domain-containing protein [Steroidobacteraceae bacterium]|nr:ribbon-helix-helix domain-containing protein [Steroidobacteraceae bacterium]
MAKATKRLLARETMYLEPANLEALTALAKRTRIPRAELVREAIDDLLVKHRAIKGPKRGV